MCVCGVCVSTYMYVALVILLVCAPLSEVDRLADLNQTTPPPFFGFAQT